MPIGGTIDRETAQQKRDRYKAFLYDQNLKQTEFVVYTRQELQNWLTNLPSNCTQILVYFGAENDDVEKKFDVFFWPYDAASQPLATSGYNIGDRHPFIPYGEL